MIDLEQIVKIKWITRNVKYYKQLGYDYTGVNTDLYVKAKHLPKNSNARVIVYCDDCGCMMETPYRNYNGIINKGGAYRCRKCNAPYTSKIRINNNKEKGLKNFERLTHNMGYKSIAKIEDYKGCDVPMPFICSKHGVQFLSISQLQQSVLCPECGKEVKKAKTESEKLSVETIIKRVSMKNNDVFLNPDEYVDRFTKNMKIKCSCGNIFITSFCSFDNSSGYCPECAIIVSTKPRTLSKDEIINRCTRNEKCYIINPDDYMNCNTKNLIFECEKCGETFIKDFAHYYYQKEIYCHKCSAARSKGEEIIENILSEYNINFIRQKRFKDCKNIKPLPFDFYLPDYNTCIEFDGKQHYEKNVYDTDKSFELRQKRDKIKTDYCKEKKIKLIRIPYLERDNIRNILKTEIV